MPIASRTLSADELDILFADACKAQTAGRFADARENYMVLLGYLPGAAILHYNFGLVHYNLEDFAEAAGEFALALVLQPDDADTLFNLALCRGKTGDSPAAIATYRQLLEIVPDSADCWYNLAGCYRDGHDNEQAIACYLRVLAIDAGHPAAAGNLAYLYHRGGDVEQAEVYYLRLLAVRPEDESAGYMLAALQGTPLDRAPDSYVRKFFDTYAGGFEQSLVTDLGYDNPRQLYECFWKCCGRDGQKTGCRHGLDLGCGTGLSGLAFMEAVTVLDGVDLSANMLSLAAGKGCYTDLYRDSIVHHLRSTADTYDFFLATDVFIYIGDLQELFAAVQAVARPAALFCFSTENQSAAGYRLTKTGRFAYCRDYIRSIADAAGWTVLAQEETRLRRERDVWIIGDLWVLRLVTAE
jgi:predicted TPR repeat methyltransferase